MSITIFLIIILTIILLSQPIVSTLHKIWAKHNHTPTHRSDPLHNDVILLTGAVGGVGRAILDELLPLRPRGIILLDTHTSPTFYDHVKHTISQAINNLPHINKSTFHLYNYNANLIETAKDTFINKNSSKITTVLIINSDVTNIQCWDNILSLLPPHFPANHDLTTSASCPITILINNAGIMHPTNIPYALLDAKQTSTQPYDLNTTLALQEHTYAVNTFAPIRLAQQIIHSHLSQPDSCPTIIRNTQLQIITITSAASMSYSTQLGPYCGSKTATSQALRAIRFEHQRLLYDSERLHHTLTPPNNSKGSTNFVTSFFNLLFCIFLQLCPVHSLTTRYNTTRAIPHVHWSTIMPWHITTPMFHNIYTIPLVKLLVPSLSPKFVAQYVVGQILDKAESTLLFGPHTSFHERVLPWVLSFTPLLNMLPVWLSDLAVGLAGGWNAMDSLDNLHVQEQGFTRKQM